MKRATTSAGRGTPPRASRGSRLARSLVLGAVLAVAAAGLPTPGAAAGPAGAPPTQVAAGGPDAGLAAPVAAARAWTYDLYEGGDFVSQMTKKRCVSAAMQIMVNVMDDGADTSAALQDRLHVLASRLRHPMEHVIGPYGWARGLTSLGYGAYAVRAYRTRDAALVAAALAVRRTGRPAGLMVWRGAHSWVLHGFQATADPLLVPDARINAWLISDPWFPRVSSIWGPSKGPDSRYVATELATEYLPWKRPDGRYPGWDGRFLVVEPIAPASHWWRLA